MRPRRRRSGISAIGQWSIVKLDIIREYATAYSTVLSAQRRLKHAYIDAFSGSGVHVAKGTGGAVWGSPTSVLLVIPPFKEYHFIDLDQGSIEVLEVQVRSRTQGPYDPASVHFYNADCNEVLLTDVFPRVRYEDYKRALCLLDPYGLHLDWRVMQAAGEMKSVEIFLNFPIMDINRNVLRRDPAKVAPKEIERMNRFWGDESWREVGYSRGGLFGFEEKASNEAVVRAFQQRLKAVAGFGYVPTPMPMRNSSRAAVYYLFFPSQKPVAARILEEIFSKHRAYEAR